MLIGPRDKKRRGVTGHSHFSAQRQTGGGADHALLGDAEVHQPAGELFNKRRDFGPEIYNKTLVTYSYQVSTEPLSDELIERISPLRGAFSDIRPVINYYRVTRENRLLFGSATRFVEYTPNDFAAWNRTLLAEVFPYLRDVKIDFAWGGPMACSANLFPQIGTLRDHNNVFYVQGYSGFGVTPSHIVCKILAEGINGGSDRYRLLSSIPHATIHGRDSLRLLLVTAGKLMHQTAGFWKGRS